MTRKAWILFAAMSVLWGTSYLFIKVAVDELSAPMVAASWNRHRRTRPRAARLCRRRAFDALRGRVPTVVLLAVLRTSPGRSCSSRTAKCTSRRRRRRCSSPRSRSSSRCCSPSSSSATERASGPRAVGLAVGLGGVATLVGFDLTGDQARPCSARAWCRWPRFRDARARPSIVSAAFGDALDSAWSRPR
ncbi:hypothetical protein ACU686_33550 [Yinghuangia aomiensis]